VFNPGANRETLEAIVLFAGLAVGAFALMWWAVAAFRSTRRRGPVTLVVLGALLAAAPYVVHALNGRALELGRPVQLLDGELQVRLTEPGGIHFDRVFRAQAALAGAGLALTVLAVLWLLARSLGKETRPRVRRPVLLFVVALVLVALPFAVNVFAPRLVDLGPRERVVDGAVHLTLTGWDQKDYSVLRAKPQTAVLQMANPDVTDATLENVKEMKQLRELDLSDSGVTDDGLAALEGLPLERLRLARTKVTDAGFKDHLAGIDSLRLLDLSGTAVSAGTIDDWKKGKPGRKALH
jgi:hypothetical protein